VAVSTRFILSRQVLIKIGKIGRTCHFIPFDPRPWSRVGDHFGDQIVRLVVRRTKSPPGRSQNSAGCVTIPTSAGRF